MIWDGFASAVGQMRAWKCSGIGTYPMIWNPNSPKAATHCSPKGSLQSHPMPVIPAKAGIHCWV
jgi:hypothetical protein